MFRKCPNTEVEMLRAKVAETHNIQRLLPPEDLTHSHQYIALKKQLTKKKKDVSKYIKVFAKKMNNSKVKHKEQNATRPYLLFECFNLRLSLSKV